MLGPLAVAPLQWRGLIDSASACAYVGEPLRRLDFPWLLNRSAIYLGLGETELREN